jgi:hypothetical protein
MEYAKNINTNFDANIKFQAVKIDIPPIICKKVLLHKKFLHFMAVLGYSFYPT